MALEKDTASSLEIAIIKVLIFFDLFEYPLTAYEIWENLDQSFRLTEILTFLDQVTERLSQKNGFYFLNGREETIITRARRYNYTYRKIKIARRFSRLFSFCPFIKLVAVANSLGQYNLREGSDIDFFIITTPRRLWLSRLYCAGLAKILRSRPTEKTKQDKICLSFYISEEHLDISDLHLSGSDPYFEYWRQNLILLYNKERVYENFLSANGLLKRADRPNIIEPIRKNFLFSCFEKLAKSLQLKIMPRALAQAMNNSDGVVVSDTVLKLYQRDRRREFAEKYGKKINEIFKKND